MYPVSNGHFKNRHFIRTNPLGNNAATPASTKIVLFEENKKRRKEKKRYIWGWSYK